MRQPKGRGDVHVNKSTGYCPAVGTFQTLQSPWTVPVWRSQNHRVGWLGEDFQCLIPTLCHGQGLSTISGCSNPLQPGCEHFQGWHIQQFSGQLCLVEVLLDGTSLPINLGLNNYYRLGLERFFSPEFQFWMPRRKALRKMSQYCCSQLDYSMLVFYPVRGGQLKNYQ